KNNGICVPYSNLHAIYFMTTTCDTSACDGLDSSTTPTLAQCTANMDYYCPAGALSRRIYLYCITTDDYVTYDNDNNAYVCGNNGFWLLIDQYGNYFDATPSGNNAPTLGYEKCDCDSDPVSCTQCLYSYDNNSWSFSGCADIADTVPQNNEFMITY
ncbi:MAG: hypothetical protein MJ163_02525, partial [Alphaproteobacteria bacterium]|nr:hypothetical protein [Alphaproteobacteria bacterium]